MAVLVVSAADELRWCCSLVSGSVSVPAGTPALPGGLLCADFFPEGFDLLGLDAVAGDGLAEGAHCDET